MRSSIPLQNAMNASERLSLESMLELNKYLVARIKEKRADRCEVLKQTIGYGDKVSFMVKGVETHGEIVKVMRKYARVNVPGGPFGTQYRVPLTMLKKEK